MDKSIEIKRVFLTGYMGSGKSFVGQKLAESLDWELVDLDELISNKQSQSIADLFDSSGERFFRKLEFDEVSKICNQESLQVIALGGGAFAQEKINDLICLDEQSITVYLKFSAQILTRRLNDEKDKRPIIAKADNLEKFIVGHLAKRSRFYEKADLIIVDEEDANQVINQISTYLNFRNQKLSTI